MTQVKEMTNAQLNRALAELMGWTNFKEGGHGIIWGTPPDDRWTNMMPDYAGDPAASLEVEQAAIKVNPEEYMRNLGITKWKEDALTSWSYFTLDKAAELHTASHRERAEAAYITLQGK